MTLKREYEGKRVKWIYFYSSKVVAVAYNNIYNDAHTVAITLDEAAPPIWKSYGSA